MPRWISNTPISLRLFATFAWATIIPFIAIVFLSSIYFHALESGRQAVLISNQTIKITTTELARLQSMHALLVALLPSVTTNSTSDATVTRAEEDVILQVLSIEGSFDVDSVAYQEQYQLATAPAMADIRQILLDNDPHTPIIREQQQLLDLILEHQWPQYKAAQDDLLIGLDTRMPLAQAAQLLQKADQLYTPLLASWQRIVDIAERVNTEVVRVGPSQTVPMLIGTVTAIPLSMLFVFTIGYLVNLTISRPLRQLIQLTRRISAGDTLARARLSGRDEIARVAASMNTMLDTIVQLMENTQQQRDLLQTRIGNLAGEVKGVGEGDLRIRADVTGDVLGVLASSFNYMISELEGLVIRIKQVAREVETSTRLTLEQMTHLSQISEFQIQQITEAAGGVEQMALASQEVAQHAQILEGIAQDTQRSATGGHQATWDAINRLGHIHAHVQATTQRVRSLGERSQEINDIVEVIFSLAYQTHRLALDSAIQAAMAGEGRKEFGAVAVRIRRLAEQAKLEANNIARIVRSAQEDIAEAATSMERTQRETTLESKVSQDVERTLEGIFATVERQARDIADITSLVTRQMELATAAVQIMQYVADLTQTNKARLGEATHHMQRLASLVEHLRVSVDAFKVSREQSAAAAPSSVASERRSLTTTGSISPLGSGTRPVSAPLGQSQPGLLHLPPQTPLPPGGAVTPLPPTGLAGSSPQTPLPSSPLWVPQQPQAPDGEPYQ
ncbi:methyl-accepting chemotaxis protein [Thermogemmatispora onikobensis]|uniref:methyl-accepting chemotaxis protein n=1 Tax=Thermogemmatispora onikobensis TaxID=732234 RepID=UPI000852BDF7|nr:methyl-accepting chemotaxis protein [Thermogemmatispora onikobensis]